MPVSLALLLRDNGLTLTEAHAAVTALAAERLITVIVRPPDLGLLTAHLKGLGLTVAVLSHAEAG